MGVPSDVAKYVKSEVKEIRNGLGAAFEHAREFVEEVSSKDLTVPTVTMYIREDIGIGEDLRKEAHTAQITGVYVPPSVKADPKVNVILYMHGDKVRVWGPKETIRDYWSKREFPLREGLSASGKPFVLIAPTLGQSASHESGNLGTKIDDHLDHIIDELYRVGPPQCSFPKRPEIDQLIIAGHSGAFKPMEDIFKSIKKYRGKIKEIWAFDIMYDDKLMHQDKSTQNVTLQSLNVPVYLYFTYPDNDPKKTGNSERRSRELAKMGAQNIFVMEDLKQAARGRGQANRVGHDFLLQRFWADRCRRIGSNGSDPDDRQRMITD